MLLRGESIRGDYDVLAFDGVDRLEYTNPAALAPYMGRAGHISIEANGQAKINVELIHVQ